MKQKEESDHGTTWFMLALILKRLRRLAALASHPNEHVRALVVSSHSFGAIQSTEDCWEIQKYSICYMDDKGLVEFVVSGLPPLITQIPHG
jgi:hypothetical protein